MACAICLALSAPVDVKYPALKTTEGRPRWFLLLGSNPTAPRAAQAAAAEEDGYAEGLQAGGPRHRWQKSTRFGSNCCSAPACPPATHNRQFLERRIAYRLQEVEFHKVNPALLERNQRRIAALIETGKVKKSDRDYRPIAGTVLTREYQEVEYRVIASADGK